MKQNAGILQQAKFLGLMLQIIAVSMVYETRAEHILASIPFGYDVTSSEYEDVERRMTVVCIFFYVTAFLEFFIIFWGQTLFNVQMNLLMVFAHAASIIWLLDFKARKAQVSSLSATLVFAGCGPFLLELSSALFTFMNYRRKDA